MSDSKENNTAPITADNKRKSNRIVFTSENSDEIKVEFNLSLKGEKASTKANGFYETRVAKGLGFDEVRAVIGRALNRRFTNPTVFTESSINYTYKNLTTKDEDKSDDTTAPKSMFILPSASKFVNSAPVSIVVDTEEKMDPTLAALVNPEESAPKQCYGGKSCTKMDDEKHVAKFAHDNDRVKKKNTKSKKSAGWKSNRTVFTDENSDEIRVEFSTDLKGHKAATMASGYYITRVSKDLKDDEIRGVINRALNRRFVNSSIFNETNVNYKYAHTATQKEAETITPLPVADSAPTPLAM